MEKKRDKQKEIAVSLQENGISVSTSMLGAFIGLAIGGPSGRIIGAGVTPILKSATKAMLSLIDKKQNRAMKILEGGLVYAQITECKAEERIFGKDETLDDFLAFIQDALSSDKSLDSIYSVLLGELLSCESEQQRDRVFIFFDAIKDLRAIHLKIMESIILFGGSLKAEEISEKVNVSETELRSVVRILELKGMIKDCGVIPITWEIRELGVAVIDLLRKGSNA